ncbi:hypothetical protein FIBSPDRAFT_960351 [Athelia psychrophila]|uniref:Uncharacterized protein n=1 Tax=Athelia psychrophila TaxID=1759441 RepID=A0A166CHL7_9AGAM|nr:hypothetical protein FIBSPDRAFT_960351 [Fibularhizoctonia sp. CBS 109695]
MSCARNSPSHQTIHIVPRLIHPGNTPAACNFDNMFPCASKIRQAALPDPLLLPRLLLVPLPLLQELQLPRLDFRSFLICTPKISERYGGLVEKVVTTVEAGRSEPERKAGVEKEEERERHQAADAGRERTRVDASAQYEEMDPEPKFSDSGGHLMNADEPEEQVELCPLPPNTRMATDLERTGLCVIWQDEDANIAIVDCGPGRGVAAAWTLSWPLPGNDLYAGLALSQKLAHYAFGALLVSPQPSLLRPIPDLLPSCDSPCGVGAWYSKLTSASPSTTLHSFWV